MRARPSGRLHSLPLTFIAEGAGEEEEEEEGEEGEGLPPAHLGRARRAPLGCAAARRGDLSLSLAFCLSGGLSPLALSGDGLPSVGC